MELILFDSCDVTGKSMWLLQTAGQQWGVFVGFCARKVLSLS